MKNTVSPEARRAAEALVAYRDPADLAPDQIRAQARRIYRESHNIIDRAERFDRDLTKAERERFSALNELARRDADALKALKVERRGPRTRMLTEDQVEHGAPIANVDEPCLRADESLRAKLEARGETPVRALGFGISDLIRAAVRGAENEREERAMSVADVTLGGYLAPSTLSAQVVDLMRPKSTIMRAGATMRELQSGEHSIPRVTGDATASHHGEGQTITVSDVTIGRQTLRPRTLTSLVKVSRELLEDGLDVEAFLQNHIATIMAAELDRAALLGTGAGAEPVGVKNWSGVLERDLGASAGDQLANWDDFLDARDDLLAVDAPEPAYAIVNPRESTTIAKFKDGEGGWLLPPPALQNLKFLSSTKVAIDETHGSATDASRIYMGTFSSVVIATRTRLGIDLLRERYADTGEVGFLAWLRYDVAVLQPSEIVMITGIIP